MQQGYDAYANSVPPEHTPHPLVRENVKRILTASPAFLALSPDKQREIANATVKVADYMVQAGGVTRDVPMVIATPPPAHTPQGMAYAQAGPTTTPTTPVPVPPVPQKPLTVEGQAAQDFGSLVQTVDFPKFVGGLIDGVFNSIVTSSIKQMEAYGEMVKNVSKSVDQYMKDNVTDNNARDYLADKYPGALKVDISGDKPTLKANDNLDDSAMPDFFSDLGLKEPVTSLDSDTAESVLVPAARRQIAMDRQQLLATMVMMGVNRLVVTDGSIEASVLFELDTTNNKKRSAVRTTDYNYTDNKTNENGYNGTYDNSYTPSDQFNSKFHQDWYSHNSDTATANFKVSTTQSTDSEVDKTLKANLTGKVKVHFKSDYFPLANIASVIQANNIAEKAQQGSAPVAAAPAAPGTPAPTVPAPTVPMPTLPPLH